MTSIAEYNLGRDRRVRINLGKVGYWGGEWGYHLERGQRLRNDLGNDMGAAAVAGWWWRVTGKLLKRLGVRARHKG